MSELVDYQSRCIYSAMTNADDSAIVFQLRGGGMGALYDKSGLRRAKRMVAAGWLATEMSPKGKTRYRLADSILAEIDAIEGRFRRIVEEAAAIRGTTAEGFLSEYERRKWGDAWRWDMFSKAFARISGASGMESAVGVIGNLADRRRPRDREQQRLVDRGLAVVHEFCGMPYLSATGAALAMRMQAIVEAEEAVAERTRNAAAAREKTQALKAANPRAPERPSFWLDLVPEEVARQQVKWEKAFAVLRMGDAGLTRADIADRMGVSKATVGIRLEDARRANGGAACPRSKPTMVTWPRPASSGAR